MQRTIGLILLIVGIIALIYTGVDYMNNSASIEILGAEVMVTEGSIIPIIISGFIALAGIVLTISYKGK